MRGLSSPPLSVTANTKWREEATPIRYINETALTMCHARPNHEAEEMETMITDFGVNYDHVFRSRPIHPNKTTTPPPPSDPP